MKTTKHNQHRSVLHFLLNTCSPICQKCKQAAYLSMQIFSTWGTKTCSILMIVCRGNFCFHDWTCTQTRKRNDTIEVDNTSFFFIFPSPLLCIFFYSLNKHEWQFQNKTCQKFNHLCVWGFCAEARKKYRRLIGLRLKWCKENWDVLSCKACSKKSAEVMMWKIIFLKFCFLFIDCSKLKNKKQITVTWTFFVQSSPY